MKTAVSILICLFSPVQADSELSYHNSSPEWLSWGGTCRGTWFHVHDFFPEATSFSVEWAEILFYTPLPDSTLMIELWNGDSSGPSEFLAQEAFSGSVTSFFPPVETDCDFWCIVNSEGCSGTAALLTDGEYDGHSFYSDDWMMWENFDQGEYFISVGNSTEALSRVSWGKIKSLF